MEPRGGLVFHSMPLVRVEASVQIEPRSITFDDLASVRKHFFKSFPVVEQAPSFGNQVQIGTPIPLLQSNLETGEFVSVGNMGCSAGWAQLQSGGTYHGFDTLIEHLRDAIRHQEEVLTPVIVRLQYMSNIVLDPNENPWSFFTEATFPARVDGDVPLDLICVQHGLPGRAAYRYELEHPGTDWLYMRLYGGMDRSIFGDDWETGIKSVHDQMSDALSQLLSKKGKEKFGYVE